MNKQDFISDFKDLSDKQKYQKLIDYSKKLETLSDEEKKEEFSIRSCQSKTWLIPVFDNNKLSFKAYSESFIVRGILYVVINTFKEGTFEEFGFYNILSDNRVLGIKEVLDKIKFYVNKYGENNEKPKSF